jgi:cytochrome c biogenesis protein CcdA
MISRTWYFIIGGVAIAIGLHLIGIYSLNIPTPANLQPKRRGIIGALLLGALFGIVSSPCATPVLALILAFVASKGEVVYGTSLLFVYAIGHCALIFLAGTAAGFVESFVQSKGITNITEWGKRIGGAIVSLVGIYLFYLGITL